MIAHIAGLPVEELVPLLSGAGMMLGALRIWVAGRRAG